MIFQIRRLSLLITLCCVLQVCVLVNGLYQLEVTVFGYNNPTGRCQGCGDTRGCCDDFDSSTCSGIVLCDSFFTYCLRTIASTGRGCSYSGNRRSDCNRNDAPLDFSQSIVLGLENPIILQGLTNAYMGVQLQIEIIDDDSRNTQVTGENDLIDVLLIDHNLPVGQPSTRQNYTGIYDIHFVTMDLSITTRCVTNFQGSDCSQCLPGFTGTMCNVNINDCMGVNCSGNGLCVDEVLSYTCDCDPGFTGVQCEMNIDDCVGVHCSGNGQCVDEVLSYTCDCDPGFTGVQCEVNIDDCVGISCGGNGMCMDGVNSFTCQCNPGFTGDLCQTNIDDCVGVNCSGNGTCVDGVNAFTCQCNSGFGGDLCQAIDYRYCMGINCSGNGVCLDGANSFTCQCSPGFGGTLCEEVIEIRGGTPLVTIVGGIVGGSFIFIILLLLLIIIKCTIGHKLKRPNIDANLSIATRENEAYGVTMATVPGQPQTGLLDNSLIASSNPCYATAQHIETVGNECYGHAPENQPTLDQSYSYIRV